MPPSATAALKTLLACCVQVSERHLIIHKVHPGSERRSRPILEDDTLPLLGLLHLLASRVWLLLIALFLDFDGGIDGQLEHFVDASRLFCGAFNILGAHLASDGLTLLRCDRCETLCSEEFDTGALRAKI